ncbi:MAG: hypothetical protein ACTHOR_09180 [Devosia sp.]|jgi:hypothetical protein
MADYRLLIAQGKQIVFTDERGFAEIWQALAEKDFLELDGELVDGDDRYMGHVAVARQHVIGLFHERGWRRAGR